MGYSAMEFNVGNTWGNISIQKRLKQRKKGRSFHPIHKGVDWVSVKSFIKTTALATVTIFFVLALCYGALQTYRFVTESEFFAIGKVTFSGQRTLTGDLLEELLGPIGGKSIFFQDMKSLEKNLAAHPWIASASVTRRLPDTLYAHVVERVPFARIKFGEVYLLDKASILLDRAGPKHSHLPMITGVKTNAVKLGEKAPAKNIISVLEALDSLNRLELFLDDPFNSVNIKDGYKLTFTSMNRGIRLFMTTETIDAGLKNLKIILNAIETKADDIERIDVSFKDKVVIKKAHTT